MGSYEKEAGRSESRRSCDNGSFILLLNIIFDINSCFRIVDQWLRELQHASELPGGLVKTYVAGSQPQRLIQCIWGWFQESAFLTVVAAAPGILL